MDVNISNFIYTHGHFTVNNWDNNWWGKQADFQTNKTHNNNNYITLNVAVPHDDYFNFYFANMSLLRARNNSSTTKQNIQDNANWL